MYILLYYLYINLELLHEVSFVFTFKIKLIVEYKVQFFSKKSIFNLLSIRFIIIICA